MSNSPDIVKEENDSQRRTIAELYNRVAAQYGNVGPNIFAAFGRRLAEFTGIEKSARVLDVGVGRGASAFPASELVGSTGLVVGIDFAAKMVQELGAEIASRNVKNLIVLQMDAGNLAFRSATFDAILCGFAVFCFLNPAHVLRQWHYVLRPGGIVGISVARGGDERFRWYEELLVNYHRTYDLPLSPGGDDLRDPAVIQETLADTGFIDIRLDTEEREFFYANPQEWWDAKWTHGARYPLEHMPLSVLEEFKARVFDQLLQLKQSDGFYERWRLLCIRGTKPISH